MSKTYEPRKKVVNLDAARSRKEFDKKADRQQGQKQMARDAQAWAEERAAARYWG